MKSYIILSIIVLLSSCVNHIDEKEESINITFKIQEYQKLPFDKSTRGDLSASCNHLAFIDYSEGVIKNRIDLTSEKCIMTFSIKGKERDGKIIYSKEFTEVPMEINSITRFTGFFFANVTDITESIIANDEWKNINNTVF